MPFNKDIMTLYKDIMPFYKGLSLYYPSMGGWNGNFLKNITHPGKKVEKQLY